MSSVVLRCDANVNLRDVWIDLDYAGSICRLFSSATGQLLADDFNRGIPWRIRLSRFADELIGAGVHVKVEAESHVRPVLDPEGTLIDNETVIDEPAQVRDVAVFAAARGSVRLVSSHS